MSITIVLHKFENQKLKITVEKNPDGTFTSALWRKEQSFETIRNTEDFKTLEKALGHAFEIVCDEAGGRD